MPGCRVMSDSHRTDASWREENGPALTAEERMLVRLREELYEGSWDHFVQDLEDRLAGRPHVFEVGAASARLQDTIREHLRLIRRLREWEQREQIDLADRLDSDAAGLDGGSS